MIRRIKSDLRTLEWTVMAEVVAIGGFICMVALLGVIWSGNLP